MTVTYPPPSPPVIEARYKGGRQVPKAIVLHGTVSSDNAGTARNIAEWWHGPTSPKTSAHYVVDPKNIFQCVGDHTVAFHCGYNTNTIGVEMCDEQAGPASRWLDADSKAIVKKTAHLVAELCLAYDIEVKRPTTAELKKQGPHGIYGHNDSRLAFGNTSHTDPRDFDWTAFIAMVRAEIADIKRAATGKPKPKPKPKPDKQATNILTQHVSMQYSDSDAQKVADLEKIFASAKKRNVAWVTGTEVGKVKFANMVKAAAAKYGYKFANDVDNTDTWAAVRTDLIKGGWKVTCKTIVAAGEGKSRAGNRGVLCVEFDSVLGHISILVCHYLTKGRPGAKSAAYKVNIPQNQKLAREVGRLAIQKGTGKALVFYAGDQNIVDRYEDTFMGQPLTSAWDELEKYENTGHGNIDVIASYDRDGRVKAVSANAYSDKDLFLFTDHFLIDAVFSIRSL